MNPATIARLFEQSKENLRQRLLASVYVPDELAKEFTLLDPRIQRRDEGDLRREELLRRNRDANRYRLREDLWSTQVSQAMLDRFKLNKQKQTLKQLGKDEIGFISELKTQMDGRFKQLTRSYERFYQKERHQAHKEPPDTHAFSTLHQPFSSTMSEHFPRGRLSAASEEKKYEEEMTKPIKSACFDMEVRKAPLTSSLKERIKLNKQLTLSPRTGQLIGVKQSLGFETGRGPKDTRAGDSLLSSIDKGEMPMSHRNLLRHRQERLYRVQGRQIMSIDRGVPINVDLKVKLRGQGVPSIEFKKGSLRNNGVYTANMAFNIKYGTVKPH